MTKDESLYPFSDISEQIRKRRYNLATKRGYKLLLKNILITVVLVILVFRFVFSVDIAKGSDMYPAVLDGDVVIGYRLDKDYLKDDVVVCEVNKKQMIGRVVAKEGDTVNITEQGVLFVNGTEQTGEIAFPTNPGNQEYPYVVPKGYVYILGDYRTKAIDSRTFGPVKKANVKSKVTFIFRKRGI